MVAPFASLEVAAAILQALYAAPPVRAAFLASRPVDTRGSDLSNYWKGSPPTDSASSSDSIAQTALDAHIDLTRRIQTLFAFATLTERPLCVVKDVTAMTPSEVVARGSDHTAPCKVASLYYEFLVESLGKHVAAYSEMILSTPTTEPEATDALWMTDALFLSSGAAAVSSPVEEPPKMEQRRSVIQLRHDSVNSDVYSCLRTALASDGEGALLTNPANVIGMLVDHANVSSTESAFTIQERIHLDSLMWDRRQGVRLDSELKDLEMVRLEMMRSELETRKRKLMGDGGRAVGEVLGGARRYFDQVAAGSGEGDEVRSASLKEAAPQIDKIVAAVDADLVATDELIAKVQGRIDAKRATVRERAKREAENPEWNQLAYDLCAVLVHEAGRIVTMVKHGEAWWKVSGGRVVRVEKEEVRMGRKEDPCLGVFWLIYAKAAGEGEGGAEGLIGEGMKAAVADDNLTYESELLSLIRSDAASVGSMDGDAGGEAGERAAADVNMVIAGEEGKSPKTG
ncbi:hypothetical protein PHSY_000406 [Pseudozyma hubeiensis SY62]|uniref:Uncharacterized protein n=1 Tax=Pseudozyma hubeiensis (strain SY62) TaxID=1305764 RepID=R9NWG1_PSEHS|nr:hypothetical protein PHSY_000406 [Pseudozyma hubeiensis SY62]GAC92849.1 hypothetical protein PHSY_000406 [Pseudozyma hubeiensis SY62]